MSRASLQSTAGTFVLNKEEPIHRWYPYLEGYSARLVDTLIQEIGPQTIQTMYDPFCGTGTTPLVASKYDILSYYSETNPCMQSVIEAKVNCVKRLRDSGISSLYLKKFYIKNFGKLPNQKMGTKTRPTRIAPVGQVPYNQTMKDKICPQVYAAVSRSASNASRYSLILA